MYISRRNEESSLQNKIRPLCVATALASYSLTPFAAPIEEVIVTAQKREQSVMDLGLSVSVVGENEIRDRRITSVTDIPLFTPNATIKEFIPGLMPIITIRGVGLNDFNAANSPTTGVFIDEVPLSSLALLSSDYFDLARMEVAKGPQGTVYGRNATAGALNVVSANPNFEGNEGRIQVGVGDYELAEIEGMFNTALSDSIALRMSGKALTQGEGFWDNRATGDEVGEREVFMGRVKVLWTPSDTTDVILRLEGNRTRSELGSPEFFGAFPTGDGASCPGSPSCSNPLGYSDPDGDPFTGDWSVDPDYDMDQIITSVRVDHDTAIGTFTSLTGYVDFDRTYGSDIDASPAQIVDFNNMDEVEQFSQEFRLTGGEEALTWQLGAFYSQDEIFTTYAGDLQALLNTTTYTANDIEATTYAFFVNGEYALNQSLILIGGVRVSDEEKSVEGANLDLVSLPPASFLTQVPFGTPPITLAAVDDSVSDTSTDWRVGLNWTPSDETLLYVSASQGTKSGGFFTGVATQPEQLQPYDPETLTAYEIGAKGSLGSGDLRYEAAAFIYDYEDVQSYIRDNSGAIPTQRLGNIPSADIQGAELSLTWLPQSIEGLSTMFTAAYLDTELGSFEGPDGTVPSGNSLPNAPETSFSIDVRYRFMFTDSWEAEVALDARYQDDVWLDALNDPLLTSDSFTVTNARLSLYLGDDLDISLWGKNVTDEEYVLQGFNQLAFGNGYRAYGPPRTWGVSLSKQF